MLNVKAKIRESLLPDIGTLYPNVGIQITTIDIKPETKSDIYYFVIWYNNSYSLVVDLEIIRDEKGTIITKEKYLNQDDKEFIPSWKNKMKDSKKPNTFNPRLHSYL